jgi:hypothetical protein
MSLALLKRAHRKTCDVLYPRGIAFHHVPKCGGSSLSRAFRLRFLFSQVKIEESAAYPAGCYLSGQSPPVGDSSAPATPEAERELQRFKGALFAYLLADDVKYVQGHVHFDRRLYEAYRHSHRFVTLLRDPVERYLSQYYYDFGRNNRNRIDVPLETFVDTPRGIATGRVFLNYFGETHREGLTEARHVDRAKANLELFTVTGLLDELDVFAEQVRHRLGVKLRIGHVNKGHRRRQPISDELRGRIRERCAVDIEIYAHARLQRELTGSGQGVLVEET